MIYTFLKNVPLFSDLPDEDLKRLYEMGEVVQLPAGSILFNEGSMGNRVYVIKEGQIEIIKQASGHEVLLAIRKSGEVIGEISLLESAPRIASARVQTDSILLAISQAQLDNLLNTSPSAARAMLHTISSRLRATDGLLRQSEKMAQIGVLTAGLAHELNNPAAAIQRGVEQLHAAVSDLLAAQSALEARGLASGQDELLSKLEATAREMAQQPADLDPLARSDMEYELENWLNQHGIDHAWKIAPNLVNVGLQPQDLENIAGHFKADQFSAVLDWLCANYSLFSLLVEMNHGAGRISEIVKVLKTYAYLDQGPVQPVNVHEGLDSTLVLLRSKLKSGIVVHREYNPDLPKIQAYGSELNQVWTNILDNAADAMNEKGEITLRTRKQGDWVVVEIEDNGPGIPEEVRSKIFDPFFTTKPPGKGTGLGLNISYNIIQKHGGEIRVYSHPGKTVFEVWLPKTLKSGPVDLMPVPGITQVDDEALRKILENTHRIAVVGISSNKETPSYSVPAYLQRQGYQIIPVNPNLEELLGEKAYPDLLSMPEPVDVVLIFRKSEAVPNIVEQAIQIGAQVVWMQEGIIHEEAAAEARSAGLAVVMDRCMRSEHRRLEAVEKH